MMDNGRYSELSKKLHQQYRVGDWLGATATLRRMALVLHEERKYRDELKVLILSYYIDLSGMVAEPFICSGIGKRAKYLLGVGNVSKEELAQIFFSTLQGRVTPKHLLAKYDCFVLFNGSLNFSHRKVLENLVNHVKTPKSVD